MNIIRRPTADALVEPPKFALLRSTIYVSSNMSRAGDKESIRLQAVQDIEELLKKLPDLPKGTKNGKIAAALSKKDRDDDPWEALNKFCDLLWGENLRDKTTGRLPNIETGKYGLTGVANSARVRHFTLLVYVGTHTTAPEKEERRAGEP